MWDGFLIIKGIIDLCDVVKVLDVGVDVIIVLNYGGW